MKSSWFVMSLLMLSMSAGAIAIAAAQEATEKPAICFASGTPPDYVDGIQRLYARSEGAVSKAYGLRRISVQHPLDVYCHQRQWPGTVGAASPDLELFTRWHSHKRRGG
jgi:hypothetical protein